MILQLNLKIKYSPIKKQYVRIFIINSSKRYEYNKDFTKKICAFQ